MTSGRGDGEVPASLNRYYTALDAGDFAVAAAAFSPDAVYIRPPPASPNAGLTLGVVQGRAEILDYFLRRGRQPFHHEVRSCVVSGRTCYVEGVVVGGDRPGKAFLATAAFDAGDLIARYLAVSATMTPQDLELLERTRPSVAD